MNNVMFYFYVIFALIIGFGFGFIIATIRKSKYWSKKFAIIELAICEKKKIKILRYCLQTAEMSCNIDEHPLKIMKNLGITYQHKTPQSMSAEWWFWNCENIPKKLPTFLREDFLDPMGCIGYGLSEEMARKIRDYKK
jgi:hypothetical protein